MIIKVVKEGVRAAQPRGRATHCERTDVKRFWVGALCSSGSNRHPDLKTPVTYDWSIQTRLAITRATFSARAA